MLSSEPLMSRTIFDKRLAAHSQMVEKMVAQRTDVWKPPRRPPFFDADPADPAPDDDTMGRSFFARPARNLDSPDLIYLAAVPLFQAEEPNATDLKACAKELPRLAGKSWSLIKQTAIFAPQEMRDLEIEPALPVLAKKLGAPEGAIAAASLRRLGERAVPVALAAVKNPNADSRKFAADALPHMEDPRLADAIPGLLADPDPSARLFACSAARWNWEASFTPRLVQLLNDAAPQVRAAAEAALSEHADPSQIPAYRQIVLTDGPGASEALSLLHGITFSKKELIYLLSSTNPQVYFTASGQLRGRMTTDEIDPLLTNSAPRVRVVALNCLRGIGDKAAVDRIVSMLRDRDEGVRWRARSALRAITGQRLGADPAAYEKWWAENKESFTRPGR